MLLTTTDLTLSLQILRPYRHHYIHSDRRHIWEFWKIGCSPSRGMGALNDPSVTRQLALIWTRDGSDHFTLQYYPNAETPQIVADLPLSALTQVVTDLRAAGF